MSIKSSNRITIIFLLILTACAAPQHRQREGDNSGQTTQMTVEDEVKMSQEVLPEMRKEYPAAQDEALQKYVTGIGNRIVKANKLDGNPYHYTFTVVDVGQVNAFALPAGTVFVTAPLIAMADSEAELAGVIGHEIGHIKARHTAERMEIAKREEGKSWLYGLGGSVLGAGAGFGLGKLLCSKDNTSCLVAATAMGGALGAQGGLLVQKFKFMANSREDEMEADRIGFRVAVNAGYDKDQVGAFYTKLYKMEQGNKNSNSKIMSSLADALSTHPPAKERIIQMGELEAATPKTSNQITSTPEFEKAKARSIQFAKK